MMAGQGVPLAGFPEGEDTLDSDHGPDLQAIAGARGPHHGGVVRVG